MSASYRIEGFKPADERWKKMKAIHDACESTGIKIQDEVIKYFNFERPDDNGVLVRLKDDPCCKEWREEMQDGFEVDVSKLPKDVTIIRFYVAY